MVIDTKHYDARRCKQPDICFLLNPPKLMAVYKKRLME